MCLGLEKRIARFHSIVSIRGFVEQVELKAVNAKGSARCPGVSEASSSQVVNLGAERC